jgi:hypothetical protein
MRRIAAIALLASAALGADSLTVFGRQWSVPFASDWVLSRDSGVETLSLIKGREPLPGPRRPFNFALTDVPAYSKITVEADARTLGRSLIVVFAYKDEAHFNYAHFSTDAGDQQPVHNGIFHVYGGERVRISNERGPAAFAASGKWYHVTLTHDPATGRAVGTVDGKPVPALEGVDLSLGAGKIGIGSFDETAEFKNVKITVTGAPAGR